jgi:hypothetical protein
VSIVDDHVEEAAKARAAAEAGSAWGAWGAWGGGGGGGEPSRHTAEVLPPAAIVVAVHAPVIVWRLSNQQPHESHGASGDAAEGVELRLEELAAHYVSFELGHHQASRWTASVRELEAVDLASRSKVLAAYYPPGAAPRETEVCMLHVEMEAVRPDRTAILNEEYRLTLGVLPLRL